MSMYWEGVDVMAVEGDKGSDDSLWIVTGRYHGRGRRRPVVAKGMRPNDPDQRVQTGADEDPSGITASSTAPTPVLCHVLPIDGGAVMTTER